jgi:uncharacterized membrane protein YhaH (DUF805 family)
VEVRIIWNVYSQFFVFEGRASRKEYWIFYLYNTLLQGGFFALDILYFDPHFRSSFPPALLFISLVNLVPFLAVTVRRLHDVASVAGICSCG